MQPQSTPFSALPTIGAALLGGIFAGITTTREGTHAAVVLLTEQPEQELTWQAAMDWAKEHDAQLPARPVSALLFANVKDQFEEDWYWTCEESSWSPSYAWYQYFGYGAQLYSHKGAEGRVRAVRRSRLVRTRGAGLS